MTCERALALTSVSASPVPAVLVFYTHHRPHLAHRDMDFFTKARQKGWHCEEILTRKFPVCLSETLQGPRLNQAYDSRCFPRIQARKRLDRRFMDGG
jgi:predicted nicotinamide N-methyase